MAVFKPIQFGKYELLDRIAVGGMAELYRAKLTGEQGFEKLLAIKKILPNLSFEENLINAFIDEAKLAALLNHENIIQIYDFGSLEEEYFIAMEFLFGKDLRHITHKARKKDQPLGLENILYITTRICAGLDYSHNLKGIQGQPLNIIHRDINPQNIFITYEGQVKIIDFGIAKAANHNSSTRENLIKGKLAYMSPEQANGDTVDHRSDIFSTGIVLYELLADKRMFEGETLKVFSLVREAEFEPPEEAIPDLPVKLYEILHRALEKNAEDRYQTSGEMLADLEECADQLSFRPSTRSLARDMKKLFEAEFTTEELALWARTQNFSDGLPESELDDAAVDPSKNYEDTVVLSRFHIPEKLLHFNYKYLSIGIVVVLVLLGIVFDIGFKKAPYTKSLPDVSAHSLKELESQNSAPGLKPNIPESESIIEEAKLAAAQSAIQADRFTLAIMLFEEILADDPSMKAQVMPSYTRALQSEAALLIDTEPDKAKELTMKALALDPNNISALSQLGYFYLSRQDYPKAIETYQKATELAPQIPDTFFNLGYVFAITGNYQQAKTMYVKAVDLAPSFLDEALFNLAMVNAELDEFRQCRKNLEKAIEINPENETAKAYLSQLVQMKGDNQ